MMIRPSSLLLAFALTAAPMLADDKTDCATSQDPKTVVAACTRVLAAKGVKDDVRAVALANRGSGKRKLADYDGAIADLTEAIALNPKIGTAFFNRGVAYYRKSDAKNAMADFSEAIRLSPTDLNALVNRSIVHIDLGDHASALADMDAAIQLMPSNAVLYGYRANIHLKAGDTKKAAADFRKVLELDPANEEAQRLLRDPGMEPK
jgi:tetratricopeptide (TPR) repeat protein